MSLLLCRQEHVSHPYYIESLGVHLYSFQELSYVIYHYPLLVMDGFVGESLYAFLRDELNQGFLALKMERWIKSGENPDEALILLLQECAYCTPGEIAKFKVQLESLRAKHPAELLKLKADELFGLRQYGRAVELYEELLEYPSDGYVDDKFRGRIWNNLGSACARMFQLEKALEAYEKAYLRMTDPQILGQIYQLTQIDNRLKPGDRLSALMTEELKRAWDERRKAAREAAAEAEPVKALETLFQKDSIRRRAGETELIRAWKQEYRSMV